MTETAITVAQIEGAEAVAGVAYTPVERALMLEDIAVQIGRATARRAVALPPDLPPATRFDPRLPGFAMPPPGAFRPEVAEPPPLPDNDADIAFAPVATLGRWLRAGVLTSVRLTRIYLDRIAAHAEALQCVATLTPELALRQAEAADRALTAVNGHGPLLGIPWACKDIFDTAGIPTEWGAEPYRGRIPARDATAVRLLAEAGAVMLGKFSVGALAYGDIWHGGRTRNPWNPREGSSGSSAGSASAVAAGLAAFALGTETLGSIVAPSLRCGTTGLRPTFGRVARTGAMPLCWTLDKIGPIARTVEDTALVLHALNAPDVADAWQIPAPFGYDAALPVAGMRVGYYPEDLDGEGTCDLDRALPDALRQIGAVPVELRRPDLPYASLVNILTAEAAASFEDLTLSGRDDDLTWQTAAAWPNTFRRARFLSAVDHVQLDRFRRLVMQHMAATFADVEAIVGPPLVGPMLIITNFTGHPCLILRSGFRQSPLRGVPPDGTEHTVPHAACVYGRLFEEGTVLRLGRALEGAFGLAGRRPPGF